MKKMDPSMHLDGVNVYTHKWIPFITLLNWRDGRPIIPLFILATKVFTRMVHKAKEMGVVEEVKVGRNGVGISHLQFSDDMLIFCLAKEDVLLNYRRLLDCFLLVFGLFINYSKFALFTVGCDEDWGNHMASTLKCKSLKLPFIYLGVPLGANPSHVLT